MNVRNILSFYTGKREAIIAIASSKHSLWLGLMFVLSAGLAREYDGEDLWHEPWHLLIPVGASLAAFSILFLVISAISLNRRERDFSVIRAYVTLLSLFWMTAPLAWLYAIPYEQFLSAPGSVEANLWSLAIVAGWRVILMVRSVSVLFNWTSNAAIWPILLFADATVLIILNFTPLPVFNVMGGIRLSDSESIIQATAFLVGGFGFMTLPIWLIGTIAVAMSRAKEGTEFTKLDRTRPVAKTVWAVAIVAILVWIPILPMTQPPQQNRFHAESLLKSNKIDQALQFMSKKQRSDFPIHWDAPPRIGYGEKSPALIDILVEMRTNAKMSPWVVQLFVDKLDYASTFRFWSNPLPVKELSDDQLAELVEFLSSHPRGPKIASQIVDAQSIEVASDDSTDDSDETEVNELRSSITLRLLQLAQQVKEDDEESLAALRTEDNSNEEQQNEAQSK